MERFKRLLLAFDGSKDSMEALAVAGNFARFCDAHLTVVYVSESAKERSLGVSWNPDGDPYLYQGHEDLALTSMVGDLPPMPHDELENFIAEDEIPRYVMNQAQSKLSKTDLSVSYEILRGKPVEELSRFARDTDADLIVIGHRGLRGFQKLVQGSVSQNITMQAGCSVFIVKQ